MNTGSVHTGSGIYSGTLVVELATGISGPYATRMLADHGADVVKVEWQDGDPYRSDPGFQTMNRNKRSLHAHADLSSLLADASADDPAATAVQRLLAQADVVVVGEPGHVGKLRSLAPNAVIVSMTAWGEDGPWTSRPPSSAAVAAATGIAWNQISYTEGPVHLALPVASYGAGLLGALAIAAGLYARAERGVAATYEVSDVAGAGAMQVGDFWVDALPVERDGSCPLGSMGRVPVYRLFEASDAQWLFVACGTAAFYERMMTVIGQQELLGDSRLPLPPWGLMDLDAIAFITPILEEAFSTRSRDEWMNALRAADVPCQPVQNRDDFMASDLAASNRLHTSIVHPELGVVEMTAPPLVMEAAPGLVHSHAPLLGQHNTEILASAEASSPNSVLSGPANAPLAGVRAIDLSSFIAGPVISRHLAMLGADVIKVESPAGDAFRAMGPSFNGWNQGKQSIVLDLRTESGQRDVHRLAAESDVVIENFRPGVAERLGCGVESLSAVKDDLIFLKSPGYGDDEALAPVPAFDPLLQALGGVMENQGDGVEPVFLTVPVHDVATPLIAAFGIVSALLHRRSTGQGQTVRTSLAHTTTAVQAAEFVRYEGRGEVERGGFDHKGPGDGYEFIENGDGWEWHEPGSVTAVEKNGFVFADGPVAAGMVVDQDHPLLGVIRQTGQLVGGAGESPGRSPLHGEHTAQLAAEFGLEVRGTDS
ncbi:MAG: crotonobetainyl-CoA:carnitine CoA-transferase CaiB-like acyl-CoA transferase [Candidatus Poriferisodalaceae bacterium]|jgi:crotonobetainyl-CoA:carnitine CoA-transferase CaiB-like acyl-CoA transferase